MNWRQWIRTVEIVPALGSAHRATVEGQVDALLRTGCRVFHLRSREDLDAALAMAKILQPALRPLRRDPRFPGRLAREPGRVRRGRRGRRGTA